MPAYTNLKSTNAFNREILDHITRIGKFDDNTSPAWGPVTKSMVTEVDGLLKTFIAENQTYFDWLGEKLGEAKIRTADAIKIAGALAANFDNKEFEKLKMIKIALAEIIAEIKAERNKLNAHLGFRGNLGFAAADGAPTTLKSYDTNVFMKNRKVAFDTMEKMHATFDKVKDEYTKRIDAAIQLAEKYRDAGQKKTGAAHDDLLELKKTVAPWLNLKSPKYELVERAKTNIEVSIKDLKTRKTVSKDSFAGSRFLVATLLKVIDVMKISLNTDHKKMEIVQAALGADWKNKNVIDQSLVSKVENGFAKAKTDIKTLGKTLGDAYEKRIGQIEKDRKKDLT